MESRPESRPAPKGLTSMIATYVGYAFVLLGLVSGANWLFGLDLAIKGRVLPADWKIALLGLVGGACVAAWGHLLGSRAYWSVVTKHGWIPWSVWPVIALVSLATIFLAVR